MSVRLQYNVVGCTVYYRKVGSNVNQPVRELETVLLTPAKALAIAEMLQQIQLEAYRAALNDMKAVCEANIREWEEHVKRPS